MENLVSMNARMTNVVILLLLVFELASGPTR
jgi:hypothetical protein